MLTTLALVLAQVVAPSGGAAEPDTPDALVALVGERVRIVDSGGGQDALGADRRLVVVGTLSAYDGQTLTIAARDTQWTLPRARVAQVSVSRGRESKWRTGAGVGAAVGGFLGLLFGVACAEVCGDSEGFGAGGAVAATVVTAAIGATAGAAVAAPFHGDRWDAVRLTQRRPRLAIEPVKGGLALSVAISLPKRAGAGDPRGARSR